MNDSHVAVDAARLVLAMVAGGTLTQLVAVGWYDRQRAADRHRLPALYALGLSLALIATDTTMRLGTAFTPHLMLPRAGIVALATWYVLERQGVLDRRRDRRRRRRL